eukprot:TRINITY_DN2350_c0_g1_i1.p1 TRINITY_DN2350_c0_g1~~TRINITY_DN2350_c0_g1_i1.p1  ORF type:complete len:732 (-),score=229.92 TRINITY_DN2350_c0_g1_i1:547-2742(-)
MATDLNLSVLDTVRDEADDVPSPLFSVSMPFWPSGPSPVSGSGHAPRRSSLVRTWSTGRAADREASFATPSSKLPTDADNLRDQLNRQKMKVARLMEVDEQRSKEMAAMLLEKRVLERGKEGLMQQVEAMEGALLAKEREVEELKKEVEMERKKTEEGNQEQQQLPPKGLFQRLRHFQYKHEDHQQHEQQEGGGEGKGEGEWIVTGSGRDGPPSEGKKGGKGGHGAEERIAELEQEKERLQEQLDAHMKNILEAHGDKATLMASADEECKRFETAVAAITRQIRDAHKSVPGHHGASLHEQLKESESRATAAEERLSEKDRELADVRSAMTLLSTKFHKEKKLREDAQMKLEEAMASKKKGSGLVKDGEHARAEDEGEKKGEVGMGSESAEVAKSKEAEATSAALAAKEQELDYMREAMALVTTKVKREKRLREEAHAKASELEKEVKRLGEEMEELKYFAANVGEGNRAVEALAAKDAEIEDVHKALAFVTTKTKREKKHREEAEAKVSVLENEVKRLVEEVESLRLSSSSNANVNGSTTGLESEKGQLLAVTSEGVATGGAQSQISGSAQQTQRKLSSTESAVSAELETKPVPDETKQAGQFSALEADMAAFKRQTDEKASELHRENVSLQEQLSAALSELALSASGSSIGKDELVRELEAYSDESERLVQALKERLNGAAAELIAKGREVERVSLERDELWARLEDVKREERNGMLLEGFFPWCRGRN